MRTPLLAALVVSVLAFPVSAGPKMSPKEQKVRKLIELTGGQDVSRQTIDQMVLQIQSMQANLPPGFIEKFRELAAKEDIVSLYVPIYMKHLEEKDVDAAIKFFSSPAGRELSKKQPAILQESMTAGQEWGRSLTQRTLDELKKTKP